MINYKAEEKQSNPKCLLHLIVVVSFPSSAATAAVAGAILPIPWKTLSRNLTRALISTITTPRMRILIFFSLFHAYFALFVYIITLIMKF